ncbi:transposase [Streptomyces sp. NBC_01214]|uniref:transposase n=1 Tax=Streptomyces sp. NBC_01214 TaxID=2903777 RepID=UPI00225454CA|nr:transposase [Streptomyces sp. NBC_01214]MCX4808137.1 transposase [Streptomyces sp. NBC_01214]
MGTGAPLVPHPAALGLPHALVALVYLRKHAPLAQMAAGFGISVGTALAYTSAVVAVLADRAYQGGGPWVTTGGKRPPGGELLLAQSAVNRVLAPARVPVERAMARLKMRPRRCRAKLKKDMCGKPTHTSHSGTRSKVYLTSDSRGDAVTGSPRFEPVRAPLCTGRTSH